jgi:hypothetical protein
MMRTLIALVIVFTSCSSSVSNTKNSVDSLSDVKKSYHTKVVSQERSRGLLRKDQLLGAWTDGSTENATFDIGKDSIFYLDEMRSFPYSLKGDSLTIDYPDMSFQGTATFLGDTLILRDPEFGTTKYTRFKN